MWYRIPEILKMKYEQIQWNDTICLSLSKSWLGQTTDILEIPVCADFYTSRGIKTTRSEISLYDPIISNNHEIIEVNQVI